MCTLVTNPANLLRNITRLRPRTKPMPRTIFVSAASPTLHTPAQNAAIRNNRKNLPIFHPSCYLIPARSAAISCFRTLILSTLKITRAEVAAITSIIIDALR